MTLRRWSLKWNEVVILVLYLQTVYKRWTWSLKVNKAEIINSEDFKNHVTGEFVERLLC